MRLDQLLALCDLLEADGVPYWLAGGWGVDVLAGEQTRDHQDVDLLVDARRFDAVVGRLVSSGFEVETDWRPVRLQLTHPDGRSVDLHPVVLDAGGRGVQAGLDGAEFVYPAASRITARLAGRELPCLTADHQRLLHSGYEPREVDAHDLAVLDRVAPPQPTA